MQKQEGGDLEEGGVSPINKHRLSTGSCPVEGKGGGLDRLESPKYKVGNGRTEWVREGEYD